MSVMSASNITGRTSVATTTVEPIDGNISTTSGNETILNPWLYSTSTPDDIIITDDYWYWSGVYYFYLVLLLLVCFGLIMAGIARRKRLAEEKRARLHAQGNGNMCIPPSSSVGTDTSMTISDNPPTYENAMANNIDAKQQLRAMEKGAMGAAMAMTASTTTIETCITEVGASRTDLTVNCANAANTSNEAPRPALH